jgi:DNA helicase II / ATP-dependent DNA helicase PcrA
MEVRDDPRDAAVVGQETGDDHGSRGLSPRADSKAGAMGEANTPPGLIWTTATPSVRALRRDGYLVMPFSQVRRKYIEPARAAGAARRSVENAAQEWLRLLYSNPRVAVLGVPVTRAGDIADVYAYLVEPAYRRDVTLFLVTDAFLYDLPPATLVEPVEGYPWSLERMLYIAERYLRASHDGLPPLTPIEAALHEAMRAISLMPVPQYGIGTYRVDFAFPDRRLAVEADGRAWHDAQRDAARDEHLHRLGWEVLRLPGSEIHRNPAAAADRVRSALLRRPQELPRTVLPVGEPSRSWWRRLRDRLFPRRPSRTAVGWDDPPGSRPASRPWDQELDPEQRRAAGAHEGVVQIVAPAGSGKTTTLIARVRELLARGVPSGRILCTTFNRATREELEDRLSQAGVRGVTVRNFHALGRMVLEEEGRLRDHIGSAPYGLWRRLAKEAMDSLPDGGVWLDAPVLSELVSDYKLAKMWDPDTAMDNAATAAERTAAAAYDLYERHLESSSQHDFDDLILRPVELLRRDPSVRTRWQGRWESVLVDEYQDVEPAQELLVRLLAAPEDSMFVVGDEDQCIYSWRRASVERIVMLDILYPGLERVVLGTSYRCPPAITTAARSLIEHNRRRFPKEIRPAPLSAEPGVIEVVSAGGLAQGAARVAELLSEAPDPSSIVALARTTRLLREVARACAAIGLPFRAPERALSPSDAERTVLAYLRLAVAPSAASEDDVRRSFRVPNRYLPEGDEVVVAACLREGGSFHSAVSAVGLRFGEEWRRKGLEAWAGILTRVAEVSGAADAIRELRRSGRLDLHYSSVEQMSPHDQVEVESLVDLEELAGTSSVAGFVTVLATRDTEMAGASDPDGVELATIHGAKGREWDTVVLFGADTGQLPHLRPLIEAGDDGEFAEALEDERRLAYVAITRSMRRVVVVCTDEPSPFLGEAGLLVGAPRTPTRKDVQSPRETGGRERPQPPRKPRPPVGRPSGGRGPVIRAKYAGRCAGCGGPISVGARISPAARGWIHERCVSR